jgi:putative hydrolase of the HAD superfamily
MITHVLFDLDNTLYPARFGLEEAASGRIGLFTAEWLGVSAEEAARRRADAMRRGYSTTLEWLAAEEGLRDFDFFYRAVHPENEADSLTPDPLLRPFLESIPPAAILTNAPLVHAHRILDILGIRDLFPLIFDLLGNGLKGKPKPEAFGRALSALGASPDTTLFVDDSPRHVNGYLALSPDAKGVLIDEAGVHADFPHARIRELREIAAYL